MPVSKAPRASGLCAAVLALTHGAGAAAAVQANRAGGGPVQEGEATLPQPVESLAPPSGLQLGLRAGFAVGFGDVFSGFPVSEGSSGSIPVVVDAGWRISQPLYVGVYGQYAAVLTKTNLVSCPDGFDCSVSEYRFGVSGEFHFRPDQRVDPWVSLGSGYEILHLSSSGVVLTPLGFANVDVGLTDRGWEFANVGAGTDVRFSGGISVGPYAWFTLAEYNVHAEVRTLASGGGTPPPANPNVVPALHELLQLGVRGTFNL